MPKSQKTLLIEQLARAEQDLTDSFFRIRAALRCARRALRASRDQDVKAVAYSLAVRRGPKQLRGGIVVTEKGKRALREAAAEDRRKARGKAA